MSNSLFLRTFAIETVLMSSYFESFSCSVKEILFLSSYGKLDANSFSIMIDKYFYYLMREIPVMD
jgi:hypothetical protein